MGCKHEHQMRKLINFDEQRADPDPEYPTPVNHQVNFCCDCWQVIGQERSNLWGRAVYLWYRFGVRAR